MSRSTEATSHSNAMAAENLFHDWMLLGAIEETPRTVQAAKVALAREVSNSVWGEETLERKIMKWQMQLAQHRHHNLSPRTFQRPRPHKTNKETKRSQCWLLLAYKLALIGFTPWKMEPMDPNCHDRL